MSETATEKRHYSITTIISDLIEKIIYTQDKNKLSEHYKKLYHFMRTYIEIKLKKMGIPYKTIYSPHYDIVYQITSCAIEEIYHYANNEEKKKNYRPLLYVNLVINRRIIDLMIKYGIYQSKNASKKEPIIYRHIEHDSVNIASYTPTGEEINEKNIKKFLISLIKKIEKIEKQEEKIITFIIYFICGFKAREVSHFFKTIRKQDFNTQDIYNFRSIVAKYMCELSTELELTKEDVKRMKLYVLQLVNNKSLCELGISGDIEQQIIKFLKNNTKILD